jgi:hypothetical protein
VARLLRRRISSGPGVGRLARLLDDDGQAVTFCLDWAKREFESVDISAPPKKLSKGEVSDRAGADASWVVY